MVRPEDAPVNIGALLLTPHQAQRRVLGIQTKLHSWAAADWGRRFDDVYNLVADPAFLVTAWVRVRENKGSRTAGVDRKTTAYIEASTGGVEGFLEDLRAQLKARSFRPLPVRRRGIPKGGGKVRYLGIPAVADRVVQACLKLVLEPILEADFEPNSYGFRPGRRAQDAIEEIRWLAHKGYQWVFEADIAACFDEISHPALMDLLRKRVGDRRVLALVKSFLAAGVLGEDGIERRTDTGTPQGGILSPLLANLALSHLDDYFQARWSACGTYQQRYYRRKRGGATYRLVRYADDFVILVHGRREHAEAQWEEVADVLSEIGLRLAPDKTRVVHIDEGFDFLGFRIQRHRQWGSDRWHVYSYPSKKSVTTIRRKIKEATAMRTISRPASSLLEQLNYMTRGWAVYFRHGASKTAFQNLTNYLWWRVWRWLRKKHHRQHRKWIMRRYQMQPWWPASNGIALWQPGSIPIKRCRFRGYKIATPWTQRPSSAVA